MQNIGNANCIIVFVSIYLIICLYVGCDGHAKVRWYDALKCDGHSLLGRNAKVRWTDTPKCDGVPYKEETLFKCNGVTRQNATASSIRKKRLSAMVWHA